MNLKITLLFFVLSISCSAKEYLFKVGIKQGTVLVNNLAFKDSFLVKDQTIVLKKDSYLLLILKNGTNFIELSNRKDSEVQFKTDELYKEILAKPPVSADLILKGLAVFKEYLPSDSLKYQYVSYVPSKNRCESDIRVMAFENTYLYQSFLFVNWFDRRGGDGVYKVSLNDLYGDPVVEGECKGNFIKLAIPKEVKEESLILKVDRINGKSDCDDIRIILPSEPSRNEMNSKLGGIKDKPDLLFNRLLRAVLFEENNYPLDANYEWQRIILENGTMNILPVLHKKFLVRVNLMVSTRERFKNNSVYMYE